MLGTAAVLTWYYFHPINVPALPIPISTPADPNGPANSEDPGKKKDRDPCEWLDNPEDMDRLLGQEGTRVPDGSDFPGRNKVVWNLAKGVQLRFEAHPYFDPPVDPEEFNPHWQFKVPGRSGHDPKYFPGDKIPGCKDGKFY